MFCHFPFAGFRFLSQIVTKIFTHSTDTDNIDSQYQSMHSPNTLTQLQEPSAVPARLPDVSEPGQVAPGFAPDVFFPPQAEPPVSAAVRELPMKPPRASTAGCAENASTGPGRLRQVPRRLSQNEQN
eukprot:RCo045236